MKVTERNGGDIERAIVIDMITNKTVLAAISAKWPREGLLKSRQANLIGGWCVEHGREYREPPMRQIQHSFEKWAAYHSDEHFVEAVRDLLYAVGDEYDEGGGQANSQYRLDQAGEYINLCQAAKLNEELTSQIALGHSRNVADLIAGYTPIALGDRMWSDPVTDVDEIRSTFDRKPAEVVVQYEGDAGKFFGTSLCRDALVAFMGPDKSGKSYFLLDIAYRAMLARKRVAYFEAGDLSKDQVKYRLYARVAQHPYLSIREDMKWPCYVRRPISLHVTQSTAGKGYTAPEVDVEYEDVPFHEPLDAEVTIEACEELMRRRVKSTRSYFRLSCHANHTLNAEDIRHTILGWEHEGWVPDIVIIDYSDLLAPMPGIGHFDERGQVNKTWQALRRISQEIHCLVVTATQTNSAAYGKELLDRRNFSEDKRKLAHATAMFGINMTASEKEKGVVRLNNIVKREGAYSLGKCLVCATCLPIANVCVLSSF